MTRDFCFMFVRPSLCNLCMELCELGCCMLMIRVGCVFGTAYANENQGIMFTFLLEILLLLCYAERG